MQEGWGTEWMEAIHAGKFGWDLHACTAPLPMFKFHMFSGKPEHEEVSCMCLDLWISLSQ